MNTQTTTKIRITAARELDLIESRCRRRHLSRFRMLMPAALVATAVALSLSAGRQALATKLNAPPLPHERQVKDFTSPESETIISQPSRFQRRPDYRALEAEKKRQDAEAAKMAEQARLKGLQERKQAQEEAAENYKQRQALAIDANNQAVAFGKRSRWAEAIAAHERAVQLDPANKQFQINLSAARVEYGKAKLAAGDLTGATGLFRKALAVAPDNGLAGRLLSAAMSKQGRDPVSADIRLATGDQLAAAGDYEGASVEYKAAMQLEPSARTYTKMGDLALTFGQLGTAMSWYRQAIVKDPDYGTAHRQLALVLMSQKDYAGAAASLRKAVILNPHDTAAGQYLVDIWRRQVAANPMLAENHLGLAGALQLTGDLTGAESEYSRLATLAPADPGLAAGRASLKATIEHDKAEKRILAGQTLLNQGLTRDALVEISQAVRLEPRNARYQFLFGRCLEAVGDYQGAHQAYLTCLLIDPENNQEAACRLRQLESNGLPGNYALSASASAGNDKSCRYAGQPGAATPAKSMNESKAIKCALSTRGAVAGQTPVLQATNADNAQNEEKTKKTEKTENINGRPQAQPGGVVKTATEEETPAEVKVQMPPDLKLADSQVSAAEGKQDYSQAVTILRKLLETHARNPNVHHRLAVNLLNAGDINDAVAEFRLSSMLNPAKKEFAEDLAQAMIIEKKALGQERQAAGEPGAGQGATK